MFLGEQDFGPILAFAGLPTRDVNELGRHRFPGCLELSRARAESSPRPSPACEAFAVARRPSNL
jgi:hypothetical protein